NVTIQNNILLTGSSPGTTSINIEDGGYNGTLNANFNSIQGTINVDDSSVIVDASANYWGTSNPTTVESRIAGNDTSNVDFTPLLDTDENVANQTIVGFQPDYSSVTVHTLGNQVGSTTRIAEGLDLVSTSGTLNIAPGTYTEDVDASANTVTLSTAGA